MSNRVKPQIFRIENIDQADEALRRIADLTIEIEAIDGKREKQIANIKEKAAIEGKPYRDEVTSLGNALSAYAEYNKEDLFTKKKTQVLKFGEFGFRKSTKIRVSRIKNTLEKLKELFDGKGIRSKEEVDKDELKTWPESDLVKVGVSKIEEENFWYETNKDRVNEDILRAQA